VKQQLSKERLTTLIHDVRADKEEHFEQLYAELLPLVYYRALVMLNDRDEAQKVTQASFIHIYKHIDELKNPDHFQAWLNAVITSACQGMLQARKHEHDLSDDIGQDMLADLLGGSESYYPDEALEAHEADEKIWAAIQALSQKQKEVILLYYIEGLSIDDIAGVLGITYTAARSRLFKARRHLLVLLEESGEKVAVAPAPGLELNSALGRMDALLILPFITRQLTQFELSPNFGELGASVARLIPQHHSLLTVAPDIWGNVVRAVGLPALAASAPTIAGTAISASQASATAAHAAHLPASSLKLIPKLISRATANPAQAAVVGVATVALAAGVVTGGTVLVRHAVSTNQKQVAATSVSTGNTGGRSNGSPSSQGQDAASLASADSKKVAQVPTPSQDQTQSQTQQAAVRQRQPAQTAAQRTTKPAATKTKPVKPPKGGGKGKAKTKDQGKDKGKGKGKDKEKEKAKLVPSNPTTETPAPICGCKQKATPKLTPGKATPPGPMPLAVVDFRR